MIDKNSFSQLGRYVGNNGSPALTVGAQKARIAAAEARRAKFALPPDVAAERAAAIADQAAAADVVSRRQDYTMASDQVAAIRGRLADAEARQAVAQARLNEAKAAVIALGGEIGAEVVHEYLPTSAPKLTYSVITKAKFPIAKACKADTSFIEE